MKFFLAAILLFFSFYGNAQKIYGTVFNERGDLLPYASVTVKGSSMGASANDKAKYAFSLSGGTYTIICQHIGYATVEKKVTVSGDTELSFILPEQKLVMTEVVVKSGSEDPAYEVIRQAIKKRNFYNTQVNGFEVDLYSKDMVKLRRLPKKILGKKIPEEDTRDMRLDSTGKGIIYLSESIATVYTQRPDKFKMEVKSSRVSGSGGFGFTFPAFISLYTNNVKVFTERINPRGFISPIADGAIGFYKFKFLGTFWEDGKAVNAIRVTPRRNYEPLFSGIINITDNEWRIHSFDLLLTKSAQLELLDTLKITQQHVPVTNEAWRVKNQQLYFNFKMLGIDAVGNFVNVYSNYKLSPVYKKNFFNNIVIRYDTAVNKRTKAYWDTIRPVPLEPEEQLDYKVKDSIYQVNKDSGYSKVTIDSLNKKQGKLKPYKVFWSGINRTKYRTHSSVTWGIKPMIPDMEYNTVEGVTLKANSYINSYIRKWKTNLSFQPHLRYGVNNGHLNAWAGLQFRTRDADINRRIKQYSWNLEGGKRVSEFNKQSTIVPMINSISILFFGENNMKTYENYFGSITYSRRFESGLRVTINGLYEDRIPLNNTTNFTIFKRDSVRIKPNYPVEKIPAQFAAHQAAIVSASISFKPGQRYIQFPQSKIAIGSKYPNFTLSYAKGISGILNSDVDFDKWKFSVQDDKNLKLAGTFKYHMGIGGFLSKKNVPIQDYQHFTGNRSLAAGEYLNSFQLAPFYGNSTTASFFSYGHVEHHFNGLLTNKIPLFKRLNWHLVAGSNALYINENNNYVELFAGLENILKVFRVDFVAGFDNGLQGRANLRVGAGGILGGSVQVSRSDNSATVNF
jgi:hypothetical protein